MIAQPLSHNFLFKKHMNCRATTEHFIFLAVITLFVKSYNNQKSKKNSTNILSR